MPEAWAPNVRFWDGSCPRNFIVKGDETDETWRKSRRCSICCVEPMVMRLRVSYSIGGTKLTVSLTMSYQASHAPPKPLQVIQSYSDVSEDQLCKYRDDRGWVRQEFLEVTGTVSALILPPQRQDSRLAAAETAMCWKNSPYWADWFIN